MINIGPIEVTGEPSERLAIFWREGKPCANVRSYPDETFSLYEHDTDRLTHGLTLRAALGGAVATCMTHYGLPDIAVSDILTTLGDARDHVAEIEALLGIPRKT